MTVSGYERRLRRDGAPTTDYPGPALPAQPRTHPNDRHSRARANPPASAKRRGARAPSPYDPRRHVIPAKAGTYMGRPAHVGTCPQRRHSRARANPPASATRRGARAPSPYDPRRHVIPAKAGTYWADPFPSTREPTRPRKRHDGAQRAPSPYDPRRHVIPAKAGTYWADSALPRTREPTPSAPSARKRRPRPLPLGEGSRVAAGEGCSRVAAGEGRAAQRRATTAPCASPAHRRYAPSNRPRQPRGDQC